MSTKKTEPNLEIYDQKASEWSNVGFYKGFDNKRSDQHCDKFLMFILWKFIQGYALSSEGSCGGYSVSHLFSTQRKEKNNE